MASCAAVATREPEPRQQSIPIFKRNKLDNHRMAEAISCPGTAWMKRFRRISPDLGATFLIRHGEPLVLSAGRIDNRRAVGGDGNPPGR
jgi:hypothetical protein